MSLQELEFYKCKLCIAQLLAGEYCIDCAKKKAKPLYADPADGVNPFIDPTITPDYDREYKGHFVQGTAATTGGDFLWNTFTSAGNATNTIQTGTVAVVSNSSTMDINIIAHKQDR